MSRSDASVSNPARLCTIALLAFCSKVLAAPSINPALDVYAHPQQLVQLPDGRRMNLYCQGSGSPAVILEAGAGGSTLDWRWVHSELAKLTRVCAYDRAGMGFSDPGPAPRTAKAVMDDFTALLDAAAIDPPYVLVAHSLGSYFVRLYTDHYLHNVAGMVLVDPSVEYQDTRLASVSPHWAASTREFDESNRECSRLAQAGKLTADMPIFKECTFGNVRDPAFSDSLFDALTRRRLSETFRTAMVSETDNMDGLDSAELATAHRSYGDIPLIVLTESVSAPEPGMSADEAMAVDRLFMRMHDELATLSTRGSHQRVANSGHYIQKDRPDVVIDAVDEVVRKVRGAKPSTSAPAAPSGAADIPNDPYLWLEQVDSPRALAWVHAENEKTAAVLEKDPHYGALYRDALTIMQATDRIPVPSVLDRQVYNLWQDAGHVRGIWRRTDPASYESQSPRWTTVLDLDVLAATENANWFLKGTTCSEPFEHRCLLSLSDGGEDAVTVREFDISDAAFVPRGFRLPRGKQRVAWEDDDSLLVSREWHPGELTASGYPFVVKRLKRDQPLSAAHELFRGTAQDGGYGVIPLVLHDGAGHRAEVIRRPLSTFEFEFYIVQGNRVTQLAVPKKTEIQAFVAGKLVISLAQSWSHGTATFPEGSLVALDWDDAVRDPQHPRADLIYAPGARESFAAASATRDALVVSVLDNVRGRTFVYQAQPDGSWKRQLLDLPDNATIEITDTNPHSNDVFLTVSGFLQPSSLWTLDTSTSKLKPIKTLAPQFDASRDTVEQFEALSKDGTRVPYFVVHPADMPLDGNHPTILHAYGGFQVSETPSYWGDIGKLWLERGGTFVLANIRGGGEFGPAWHEAGLKTHRQVIYDDFTAVAHDLIARGITSPRRLGIMGGSNGGLLMGVELTQHPDIWSAVDIQIPLLDMLRYEKIAAGPSWAGEYGSVSKAAEAAFLAKISPYANIRRDVHYPEPFIRTTTKDDRVGPQHARKFAARLSEYGIPYFFYEVTEGGHGSGANLEEQAHTAALEMTYFTRKLMD